jgi:hypothetical protein
VFHAAKNHHDLAAPEVRQREGLAGRIHRAEIRCRISDLERFEIKDLDLAEIEPIAPIENNHVTGEMPEAPPPEAIEATVEAAISIARFTAPDPCAGLADAELMAKTCPDLDLHHPWRLSV